MKRHILWLALMPWAALSSAALADEASDARITKLEQELAAVKARQDGASWTDRFKVNGFASVGVGTASNDGGLYGYDEDIEWKPDSVVGVQMTFQVNEQTEATVQLQARGAEDWDPEIEWAFLAYTFDSGTKLRLGKLRLPLYMYSDYLEVGYAYPFARPSVDVYSLVSFTSYTGADAIIPFDLGSSTLSFQPFTGTLTDKVSGTDVTLKNIVGLVGQWEYDSLTLRGIYGQGKVETAPTGALGILDNTDAEFNGIAASWDAGDYFITAEWARRKNEGVYPDADAMYAVAGYRFDALTPYLMVGQTKTQDDDLRALPPSIPLRSALDIRRTSYSAGIRWDFMPQLALKFDVTYAGSFDDTTGGLSSNTGYVSGIPVPVNLGTYDDTTIYSVVLDAVF